MSTSQHKIDTVNGLLKMQAYATCYLHDRFEQTNNEQYKNDIQVLEVTFKTLYNKLNK